MANPLEAYGKVLTERGLGTPKTKLEAMIESGKLKDPKIAIPQRSGTGIDDVQRFFMGLGNVLKAGGASKGPGGAYSPYVPPKNVQEATKQIVEAGDGNIFEFVPPPGYEENLRVGKKIEPGTRFSTADVETSGGQGELGAKSIMGLIGAGDSALAQLGAIQREEQKAQDAEDFRAKEAKIAEAQGMPQEKLVGKGVEVPDDSDPLDPFGGKGDPVDPVQSLFAGGMEEYIKAAQIELPPELNREQAMERYKKEFADATGLKIDGKPDKSLALMSLGLALMQNRAGKNFNVGRILSSVGEAGQAALPVLAQAKKEAKEAQMAAGQYALEMIKSDQDARQAIKTQNAAIRQQFLLKNFEAENEAKLEMQKAILEGGKDVDQLPSKFFDQEIQIGSNTYKMKRGVNPSNLQSVFVDPVTDSAEIVNSYNKTMGGLQSISEMEKLTQDLIDISDEQVGGLTAVRFLDKAEGVLKSMGLSKGNFFNSLEDEELKELGVRKLSIESEIDTIRRAFIMRFKRFISQETGNGISNVDVQNIERASGQLEELFKFDNPEASLKAFKEIRQIFDDSALTLNRAIEQFTDRREYYDGKQGDELYTRTMEAMQKGLTIGQEFGLVEAKVVKNDDGSEVITYDLTTG
jgi:hypothetical protein